LAQDRFVVWDLAAPGVATLLSVVVGLLAGLVIRET